MPANNLEQLCVNTIRTLSMDAVEAANSGHPGMPMGMADAAFVLWTKFLRHNPANPDWFNRDRFVLSAGHGSMLLYSLLHLTGYDVPLEELKNFRQLHSITPGHPESHMTPGVETTTGPLGQGFATGIGMAIAEAHLAAKFGKKAPGLVDHFTYAIVSDGDLMEGISHEAASMAGHMKLGKIIYLYDSNGISIDGSTDLAFTDDSEKRFDAYGWHVVTIDGHNHDEVESAIREAQGVTDKPSLIICKTHIGYGSPNKQDSESSHGSPLGEEEVRLTKENLGWDPDKTFYIPDEVAAHYRKAVQKGAELEKEWNGKVDALKQADADTADLFNRHVNRQLPDNLADALPVFEPDPKGNATRNTSKIAINAISKILPQLFGGSADLTGSTKTDMTGEAYFSAPDYLGRNVHYGVREHGMAAAVNGITHHGGLIPFGASFLIFSDYCRPSIRIAALSRIPSIFVFTHDSIGLGEDGPTHQSIEQIPSLRAMPNLCVLRPADANETAWAWKVAVERTDGPTLMALTRQNLPTFDRPDYAPASMVEKGAYILKEASSGKPDVLLLATGSEVSIIMEAADILAGKGVQARVVSMPSWELFEAQADEYKKRVLPPDVTARVSVEAAATFGWQKWIGLEGVAIGLDRFGESAPYEEVYRELGITSDRVVTASLKLLGQ